MERTLLLRITPACAGNTLWGLFHLGYLTGITPACAGNTSLYSSRVSIPEDHPRLRGEYHRHCLPRLCCLGSPPLARGILLGGMERTLLLRITPACAGNTRRPESPL